MQSLGLRGACQTAEGCNGAHCSDDVLIVGGIMSAVETPPLQSIVKPFDEEKQWCVS